DPMGDDAQKWFTGKGMFPIRAGIVKDVGAFYTNTGRLLSIIWAMLTTQDATPDLYKVHVGTPESDDDRCLHYRWRSYFQGALDFILENSKQYLQWHDLGLTVGGRVQDANRPEFLFGTALSCVAGVWTCMKDNLKSTNHKPVFRRACPGYPPQQMGITQGLNYGCVVAPWAAAYRPLDADDKPESSVCLRSIYDHSVRGVLVNVRARQEHFLRRSLVCAYVREAWDAFLDPALLDQLRSLRVKLLTHKDRFLVDIREVPEDEPFGDGSKTWKQALMDAGVNKWGPTMPLTGIGGVPSAGSIEPSDEPAPAVQDLKTMPFAGTAPDPTPWWRRKTTIAAAGATVALGGIAAAVARARSRG
ncbi:MAG: hypothetical protein R3A51_23230, partial [Nannocystaceae bacterium]